MRRCVAVLVVTGAILLFQQFLFAHEGVADQIAAVSGQILKAPANPELLVKRAELYRVTRRYTQALADLDRATALNPKLAGADFVRAHLFLDAGNPQGAADAASRFLTHQPGHVDVLIVRARARARLGRARDAATDFTQALASRPMPDWYVERARANMATGGHGIDEALRGLDDGIRRLGPIVTLELEAIDLELRLNRHDAALVRLARVSAQTPRQETWLARRGRILESAGRIDEARASYRAALAAAGTLPPWTQRAPASSALIERLRADLARLEIGSAHDARRRGKGAL